MNQTHKQKRIQRLSPLLVDRIAAGEVIEGPSSVVKELLENALDSGATEVRVSTGDAGLSSILIEDNGHGISYDELPLSVERHATSKIQELEDIDTVLSFGFRGEALASIASISLLEIQSRRLEDRLGGIIECRGGEIARHEKTGARSGTVIHVQDLFYSVPARKKFIKSEKQENKKIYQEIIKIALSQPGVSFQYEKDGKTILDLDRKARLMDRLEDLYKRNLHDKLIPVSEEISGLHMHGFISTPSYHRSNKEGQFFYVNQRSVEIKNLPFLIRNLYGERIPAGTHPYLYLFFDIEPGAVDINVHPAKKEIRFKDEKLINAIVVRALQKAFEEDSALTLSSLPSKGPFAELDYHSRRMNTEHDQLESPGFLLQESRDFTEPSFRVDSNNEEPGHHHPYSKKDESPQAGEFDKEFIEDFENLRYAGIVFKTFILAHSEESFYMIDQHTAHERINYEKIRKQLQAGGHESQTLLQPVVVKCLEDELETILDHREYLQTHGFEIESFGKNSYIVRSVPVFIDPGEEEKHIAALVDRALEGTGTEQIYDDYAAMKACRASVKRNDVLKEGEAKELIRQLLTCDKPARCPHGRPTMIRITRDELDRLFMRMK